MFSRVVKKCFLQEREKSQTAKNRIGSQVFCFEATNRSISKQTSKHAVLKHDAFSSKVFLCCCKYAKKMKEV